MRFCLGFVFAAHCWIIWLPVVQREEDIVSAFIFFPQLFPNGYNCTTALGWKPAITP